MNTKDCCYAKAQSLSSIKIMLLSTYKDCEWSVFFHMCRPLQLVAIDVGSCIPKNVVSYSAYCIKTTSHSSTYCSSLVKYRVFNMQNEIWSMTKHSAKYTIDNWQIVTLPQKTTCCLLAHFFPVCGTVRSPFIIIVRDFMRQNTTENSWIWCNVFWMIIQKIVGRNSMNWRTTHNLEMSETFGWRDPSVWSIENFSTFYI